MECRKRVESGFLGNHGETVGCIPQKRASMLDTEIVDIVIKGRLRVAIEPLADISAVATGHAYDVRQLQTRIKIDSVDSKKLINLCTDSVRRGLFHCLVAGHHGHVVVRFAQFLDNRFVLIDEVADDHPHDHRHHKMETVEQRHAIDTADNPKREDEEESIEYLAEPVEIDIVVIRKLLLQRLVVSRYGKYRPHKPIAPIDGAPHGLDIIPHLLPRATQQCSRQDEEEFVNTESTPREHARFAQFDKYGDIDRDNRHVPCCHDHPRQSALHDTIVIENHVFDALRTDDTHHQRDQSRETVGTFTEKEPHHHSVEHSAKSVDEEDQILFIHACKFSHKSLHANYGKRQNRRNFTI